MKRHLVLCLLLACSESSSPLDAPRSIDAPVKLDAPPPSCNFTSGLFQCGSPSDNKSCRKDLDFCVVGDPIFGVAWKSQSPEEEGAALQRENGM